MPIIKKSVSMSSRIFYLPREFLENFPKLGLLKRQVYTECDGKTITIKPLACYKCGAELDNNHIRNMHFICEECETKETAYWNNRR